MLYDAWSVYVLFSAPATKAVRVLYMYLYVVIIRNPSGMSLWDLQLIKTNNVNIIAEKWKFGLIVRLDITNILFLRSFHNITLTT